MTCLPLAGGRKRREGPASALHMSVFAALLATAAWTFPAGAQTDTVDVLIMDARVVDGSGNPWYRADIAIRGDEILAIGKFDGRPARRTIDAAGRVVAPGFIDLHSHADRALASTHLEARRAISHVTQGITTVLGAPDGANIRWPLAAEAAAYRDPGVAMNVVLMAGLNSIRTQVMRSDSRRPATAEEIERMRTLLDEMLRAGAWGLSASLEYRPARYSTQEEVRAVAGVVADYDGFYIAHQRSEAMMPLWQLPSLASGWPTNGLDGLKETIEIGRHTNIRVVGSHHKARGRSSFGRSLEDIRLIDRARAEGVEVYLDVYPYDTFGEGSWLLVPRWAMVADSLLHGLSEADDAVLRDTANLREARSHLARRWTNPAERERLARDIAWNIDHSGGPDRVYVLDFPDRSLVGKTLREIADLRGTDVLDLVVWMALEGYPGMLGGAAVRGHGMHDSDIEAYYRQDYTATSSDAEVSGVAGVPEFASRPGSHPRHFGAFVRKITHFALQRQVVSLPHSIRSATGLPAQIIGLRDRGYVREGYKADLVILDLQRLADRATVLEPARLNEGVDFVMVNGIFTVDEGRPTGRLPGTVVARSGDR